jgi:hypothetical protein
VRTRPVTKGVGTFAGKVIGTGGLSGIRSSDEVGTLLAVRNTGGWAVKPGYRGPGKIRFVADEAPVRTASITGWFRGAGGLTGKGKLATGAVATGGTAEVVRRRRKKRAS